MVKLPFRREMFTMSIKFEVLEQLKTALEPKRAGRQHLVNRTDSDGESIPDPTFSWITGENGDITISVRAVSKSKVSELDKEKGIKPIEKVNAQTVKFSTDEIQDALTHMALTELSRMVYLKVLPSVQSQIAGATGKATLTKSEAASFAVCETDEQRIAVLTMYAKAKGVGDPETLRPIAAGESDVS